MRSKKCQIGYDIEKMKNERDVEKSKKDTLWKYQWRQQKQVSDCQSYRKSRAAEKAGKALYKSDDYYYYY